MAGFAAAAGELGGHTFACNVDWGCIFSCSCIEPASVAAQALAGFLEVAVLPPAEQAAIPPTRNAECIYTICCHICTDAAECICATWSWCLKPYSVASQLLASIVGLLLAGCGAAAGRTGGHAPHAKRKVQFHHLFSVRRVMPQLLAFF